jgi:hypothetical protein
MGEYANKRQCELSRRGMSGMKRLTLGSLGSKFSSANFLLESEAVGAPPVVLASACFAAEFFSTSGIGEELEVESIMERVVGRSNRGREVLDDGSVGKQVEAEKVQISVEEATSRSRVLISNRDCAAASDWGAPRAALLPLRACGHKETVKPQV